MIFMPPRHGKSELASRRFPAWYMGRNPKKQMIAASYNSELAADFGRGVRNIVASHEYKQLFSVALSSDSHAADRWNTNLGGSYVAAGVGTAITGRGANVALIDDPLKDREEADSETTREKVWRWYTSTLYTRLMPGGAIILIQTRWHDDDLAGRLLKAQENGGDRWTIIEMPARSEGQALWPEWFPLETLARIERAIGPRDWNALYQQNPIPDDGDYFKREQIQWYEWGSPPKHLRIYGASDFAVTQDAGDWTEHGVCGVDANDDLYLLDWWRDQTTPDQWIEAQLDLVRTHKPLLWAGESGPIRRSVEPFLLKRMKERRDYCRLDWLASIADKPTRARAIQARFAMRKVFLPRGAPFVDELVRQLLRFPAGAVDDGVDVLSLFGRILDQMRTAIEPTPVKLDPIDKPPTFNDILKSQKRHTARGRI